MLTFRRPIHPVPSHQGAGHRAPAPRGHCSGGRARKRRRGASRPTTTRVGAGPSHGGAGAAAGVPPRVGETPGFALFWLSDQGCIISVDEPRVIIIIDSHTPPRSMPHRRSKGVGRRSPPAPSQTQQPASASSQAPPLPPPLPAEATAEGIVRLAVTLPNGTRVSEPTWLTLGPVLTRKKWRAMPNPCHHILLLPSTINH